MQILRSITTVGSFTFGTRLLGILRDILVASLLGTSPAADALVIAMKVPSFFRRFFAEGAINAAFVPIFAGLQTSKGIEPARKFAQETFSVVLLFMGLLVIGIEIFMPQIMAFCVPGFRATPERMELVIQFTRITLPFILLIAVTALYSGILNSLDRFAAVAASPMYGNLFLVFMTACCIPIVTSPGHVLSFAILGCGIVQLFTVLFPCHRLGINLHVQLPTLSPHVRQFLKIMAPVAFSSGFYQINIMAGLAISSLLPVGGVSCLYYAERFNQVPISVVGTAMGTVLLPFLTRLIRANQWEEAHKCQNQGIELGLLISVPILIGLLFLAQPLVQILLERNEFGADDTLRTAQALQYFALGLPAYVLTKIFTTRFFAQQDSLTPLLIALVCILIDVLLSLYFIGFFNGYLLLNHSEFLIIRPMAHQGIALATALAAWANVLLLGWHLWAKGYFIPSQRLKWFLPRLAFVGVITTGVMGSLTTLATPLTTGAASAQIFALALLIAVGLLTYLILGKLTGAVDMKEFNTQLLKSSS
jgi:putative peptidoglycan lipid II flippase